MRIHLGQYYSVVWTDLGGTDWVLGFNPYTGDTYDENGNIIYDPANNVISANGDGDCEIVAVCGDLTASVPVRIVDVQGTIHAYNYFSYSMEYGNWITMDMSDLTSVTVDFIALTTTVTTA